MFIRFAVETKFIKLAVETKLVKLGTEMKGRMEEASSAGSIKLLMYLSSPAVVEIRLGEESKFRRFGVETKFIKFCVETKLRRLGVETTPGTEERYPAVPRPLTVEATCVSRYVVETKLRRFAVETKLRRFAVETKFVRFAVDTKFRRLGVETTPRIDAELTYPAVPSPVTVDVIITIFTPPGPNAVENEEIAFVTKVVEAYPIDPNPATVEIRFSPPLPFVRRAAVK
jgi:hypothetical protein